MPRFSRLLVSHRGIEDSAPATRRCVRPNYFAFAPVFVANGLPASDGAAPAFDSLTTTFASGASSPPVTSVNVPSVSPSVTAIGRTLLPSCTQTTPLPDWSFASPPAPFGPLAVGDGR